ncbi:hypothetical protein [Natronincola ferrireducens]|nr:hypothetical protein [Natronincola ferrireducens]
MLQNLSWAVPQEKKNSLMEILETVGIKATEIGKITENEKSIIKVN